MKQLVPALQIEAFFSGGTLTKDRVTSRMNTLLPAVTGALDSVYAGKTPVSAEMAEKLATLYAQGEILPADSFCHTGSHEACMLLLEKAQPQGNAESEKAMLARIAPLLKADDVKQ